MCKALLQKFGHTTTDFRGHAVVGVTFEDSEMSHTYYFCNYAPENSPRPKTLAIHCHNGFKFIIRSKFFTLHKNNLLYEEKVGE